MDGADPDYLDIFMGWEVDAAPHGAREGEPRHFHQLNSMEDADLQTLLWVVDNNTLLEAMQGAAPPVLERILGNMSDRSRHMLFDDLELLPPAEPAHMEEHQRKLMRLVARLIQEGRIPPLAILRENAP